MKLSNIQKQLIPSKELPYKYKDCNALNWPNSAGIVPSVTNQKKYTKLCYDSITAAQLSVQNIRIVGLYNTKYNTHIIAEKLSIENIKIPVRPMYCKCK